MPITLKLQPIVDLSPYMADASLATFNIGPDSQIYVVLGSKDYPRMPRNLRVMAFYEGSLTFDRTIENVPLQIDEVQPLPDNELLLASDRSNCGGPDTYEKNGLVYSASGEFKREFLLGDGIEDLQTTSDGVIWSSFFDQGVMGDRGWIKPVGRPGLVAHDKTGKLVFEYQSEGDLDSVFDCYALNVQSNTSTWIYYHPQFPLVHIRNMEIEDYWMVPLRGCTAFAVDGEHVLFNGDYDQLHSCSLLKLKASNEAQRLADFNWLDQAGERIECGMTVARAEAMYIFSNERIYHLSVADALQWA